MEAGFFDIVQFCNGTAGLTVIAWVCSGDDSGAKAGFNEIGASTTETRDATAPEDYYLAFNDTNGFEPPVE